MRQKLNENQTAQIALLAVLALVVGFFVLKGMGGGSESSESAGTEAAPAETTASTEGAVEPVAGAVETAAPVAATSGVAAPVGRPLPKPVDTAYEEGETIVLLIYRPGGIDDRRVAAASSVLTGMPGVAYFPVPASRIADYSAITGPLGVNSAPALIVVRPRALNGGGAAPATVTYGFQTASDVQQAVIDAGYQGPQLTYAPQ
jgi:hypothetical protein